MPQSLADMNVHIVFSTKRRAPVITPEIWDRLRPYLAATAQSMKCQLVQAGGMPDHLHLLVSWARDLSLSDGVRNFKASSSRWIHDTFPESRDFAWQDGYGGFSVSRSLVPKVQSYIQNQEAHHRQISFQDELRMLLEKHGLNSDERYLWD